jgi:hypothetical protein
LKICDIVQAPESEALRWRNEKMLFRKGRKIAALVAAGAQPRRSPQPAGFVYIASANASPRMKEDHTFPAPLWRFLFVLLLKIITLL